MAEEISLERYKQAYREMRMEEEKRVFLIHLVDYAFVNAALITLNLLYVPEVIWFFWPLLGWGIGIAIHYLVAVRWLEKGLRRRGNCRVAGKGACEVAFCTR